MATANSVASVTVPTRLANTLSASIFVLVPFHAFLTVWAATFVGHFVLLRLWDEILLALLVIVVGYLLVLDKAVRQQLLRNRLVQLVAVYALYALLTAIIAFARGNVSAEAIGYGLIINLRFLVWFVAIWVVASRSMWLRTHWKKLVFAPLAVVVLFGLLQFFIWPPNVLANFGYGQNTFVPYITINQDSAVVRVQATLRGANQLGAYLGVIIILLAALLAFSRRYWRLWLLAVGASMVLLLSFSRSGWFLAAFGVLVVYVVRTKWRIRAQAIAWLAIILIATGALLILPLKANQHAQDVVLHVSDHSTAAQSSNEQHLSALTRGVSTIMHEPLGRGPGSSGAASWYNTGRPIRNPESYLLQIGEESGWLGLGLFLGILGLLGRELWKRRREPLALGLFASLVGLILIGLVSYTWADDTLAFVWWGLAGIALAAPAKAKQ